MCDEVADGGEGDVGKINVGCGERNCGRKVLFCQDFAIQAQRAGPRSAWGNAPGTEARDLKSPKGGVSIGIYRD